MVNSGDIVVGVGAVADADNVADALASASHLIGQFGFAFEGDASLSIDNDGLIAIEATAVAEGDSARARAALGLAL